MRGRRRAGRTALYNPLRGRNNIIIVFVFIILLSRPTIS